MKITTEYAKIEQNSIETEITDLQLFEKFCDYAEDFNRVIEDRIDIRDYLINFFMNFENIFDTNLPITGIIENVESYPNDKEIDVFMDKFGDRIIEKFKPEENDSSTCCDGITTPYCPTCGTNLEM